MTKPTKWPVRPVKTQIRLGICPVWSEPSLSAWGNLGTLATQWVDSMTDQTGRMFTLPLSWYDWNALGRDVKPILIHSSTTLKTRYWWLFLLFYFSQKAYLYWLLEYFWFSWTSAARDSLWSLVKSWIHKVKPLRTFRQRQDWAGLFSDSEQVRDLKWPDFSWHGGLMCFVILSGISVNKNGRIKWPR